jgi:hypothetical protein
MWSMFIRGVVHPELDVVGTRGGIRGTLSIEAWVYGAVGAGPRAVFTFDRSCVVLSWDDPIEQSRGSHPLDNGPWGPQTLTIVSDDNYPPFIFRSSVGQLRVTWWITGDSGRRRPG